MAGARDSWGVARCLLERSGFLAEVSRCPPQSYQMSGLSSGFDFLTLSESEELRCRQNLTGRLSVVCMFILGGGGPAARLWAVVIHG